MVRDCRRLDSSDFAFFALFARDLRQRHPLSQRLILLVAIAAIFRKRNGRLQSDVVIFAVCRFDDPGHQFHALCGQVNSTTGFAPFDEVLLHTLVKLLNLAGIGDSRLPILALQATLHAEAAFLDPLHPAIELQQALRARVRGKQKGTDRDSRRYGDRNPPSHSDGGL